MSSDPITAFWQTYLETLPPDAPQHQAGYLVDRMGDTPDLADELGALIVSGVKTATCSARWEWEAEDRPLPQPGLLSIILDSDNQPLCIIETTEVTLRAFKDVDADFAAAEGEDDRSLESWREEHWRYFSRVLPCIGHTPTEDMPLVCERFRLVYPFK